MKSTVQTQEETFNKTTRDMIFIILSFLAAMTLSLWMHKNELHNGSCYIYDFFQSIGFFILLWCGKKYPACHYSPGYFMFTAFCFGSAFIAGLFDIALPIVKAVGKI